MNKSILAKLYADKMVSKWAEYESGSNGMVPQQFSLEHKLHIAFKAGFDSGQRHQKKLVKKANLSMKVAT